jgi:hypothetical protein
MRSVMICTPHPLLCGDKIENEMGGACTSYGEGRGLYKVLVGNLGERDHSGDQGVDGSIILRRIFRKWGCGGIWIGLSWLRIEINGWQW